MLKKMPFILICVIVGVIILAPMLPLFMTQLLYSISLSIQKCIELLLPLIIFGLLFKSTVTLSKNASKIIGIILLLVCISNFFSTVISHCIGEWVYGFNLSMILPSSLCKLDPLWQINPPKLIQNSHAMFAGLFLGILGSHFFYVKALQAANAMEKIISKILQSFTYFIPLFIAGFVAKMQYDNVISIIIKEYFFIFGSIALALLCYLLVVYFLLSNCNIKKGLKSISNMIPAALSGFSTMSSAASMPLSLIGVENNTLNKDIARSVIPATVNIHLVGDCFAIPIFAYAILKSFGVAQPSIEQYMTFSFYFVLAKFSVAAIPGGGILVMLPILKTYLNFNAEMMSLITALYVLFDPVITCANVLGNGAFAMLIDKIAHTFIQKKH